MKVWEIRQSLIRFVDRIDSDPHLKADYVRMIMGNENTKTDSDQVGAGMGGGGSPTSGL
jgi:hypothetical protein